MHESRGGLILSEDGVSDDEVSSNGDDSEFDEFDEDNDSWPKQGVSTNPHGWELAWPHSVGGRWSPRQIEGISSFIPLYHGFIARLSTLLRQNVPEEQLSPHAIEDLKVRRISLVHRSPNVNAHAAASLR